MLKLSDKRCYLLIALLFFCSCNYHKTNNHVEKDSTGRKHLNYPVLIDSLKLNDFYDSAIWRIYSIYCDKPYLPKDDSSKSYTFGQFALKFEDLLIKNDTLELHFWFILNNKIILPSMNREFEGPLLTGVGFNTKTKKRIYTWSPSGFTVTTKGDNLDKSERLLQSRVLTYINNNKNSLDSTFKLLAELKGILK